MRVSTFKCPNCNAPISIGAKLTINLDKHITCKKCSQELKPVKLFMYAVIFIAPTIMSLLVHYAKLNYLTAAGGTFVLCFFLLASQPLRKM
ncbi:hypothetical protein ACX10_06085 [Vibrio parahaemolyticus]|nr:hypothetical protein ACX10_06085 [Vibrio parahaemolyticus]